MSCSQFYGTIPLVAAIAALIDIQSSATMSSQSSLDAATTGEFHIW